MSGPKWRNERGPVFKSNPPETPADREKLIVEKGLTVGSVVTWFKWALVGDNVTGMLRGADSHTDCKVVAFTPAFMVKINVPSKIIQRGKHVATTWEEKRVSPRNLKKQ